jgi:hypothetical protein
MNNCLIKIFLLFGALFLAAACADPGGGPGAGTAGEAEGTGAALPNSLQWAAAGNAAFGASGVNAIAFGAGRFVAGGENGKMAHSPDGASWTAVSGPFGADSVNAIAFGGNKFVAGGDKGKMAYSADGSAWIAVSDSTFGTGSLLAGNIYAVAFGGNRFVAGGGYTYTGNILDIPSLLSYFAYSADGSAWIAIPKSIFGTHGVINAIAYGGGRFAAAGKGGTVAYSSDGVNWYAITNPALGQGDIRALAFGGGRFVAGGAAGLYEAAGGRLWYTE